MSEPYTPEQVTLDLEQMWASFAALPDDILISASFGVVALRPDAAVLLDIDSEGRILGERPLTTDEIAQFKTEYPRLFGAVDG